MAGKSVNGRSVKFYAKTIEQCWNIARRDARRYQALMARALEERGQRHSIDYAACRAARNAADRIALEIRYGRLRRQPNGNGNHRR